MKGFAAVVSDAAREKTIFARKAASAESIVTRKIVDSQFNGALR